jgi:hypothetical protein
MTISASGTAIGDPFFREPGAPWTLIAATDAHPL